jgi:hypothetical protein
MDMQKKIVLVSFSFLYISICLLMAIVIEIENAVRFVSQLENDYY